MPEDVVSFLEEIFDKPMHTSRYDPGYATRVVGSCPPPSNSSILVRVRKMSRDICVAVVHYVGYVLSGFGAQI